MLDYLGDYLGFPGGASGKEPTSQCRRHKRCRFDPWVRKVPLEESVATTPVFLPGEDPLDRGAWQATVQRVIKSRTRLKQLSTHIWVSPV